MPLAESWLKWEEMSGGRAILKGSIEDIRGQFDGLVQALIPMMPPMPEGTNIVEGNVDGIKYRTYTPKEGNGPFPIALCERLSPYRTRLHVRVLTLHPPQGHMEAATWLAI